MDEQEADLHATAEAVNNSAIQCGWAGLPAIIVSGCVAAAAATSTIKLAVETMPLLAPSTATLNHPVRSTR